MRFFKHDLQHRALIGALCLTSAAFSSAFAAPIFNWSGIDTKYITSEGHPSLLFQLTQAPGNSSVWQRSYSDSTALTEGLSNAYNGAPIYGAVWRTSSAAVESFYRQRLRNGFDQTSPDIRYETLLELQVNGSGETAEAGALIFFKKENFAGFGAGATFAIDETSSLSGSFSAVIRTTVRLAILNDGQWYLSEASVPQSSKGTALELGGMNLYTSLWAEWDPMGGPDGRLGETPAANLFGIAGSTFQNIEAVGFYSRHDLDSRATYVNMSGFQADFQVIPEPGIVALLLAGVPVYWFVRMRRKKVAVAL